MLFESYWAKEVTFNYGRVDQFRVDYMKFKPVNQSASGIEKGVFTTYEIKSCLDDFRSINGHNHIAEKNYYVMPLELYRKVAAEIKSGIGVYVPVPYGRKTYLKDTTEEIIPFDAERIEWELYCVKKSRMLERNISNQVALFNMFRSGK